MLNILIARCVADALQPLNGPRISRLAGLVKVLETDAFTPGRVSKFPIPVEATLDACAQSGRSFPDLVPTDKERFIVYCEDNGSNATEPTGRKWRSTLRLVGWGNSSLFVTDRPPEMTGALLIAELIGHLRRNLTAPDNAPIRSLELISISTPPAGANLFEKYTYSEMRAQYLLPPYFAFGLDLQLTFTLNVDCNSSITALAVYQH